MTTNVRSRLDSELARLTETILEMGSRVRQAVGAAMRAFADRDLELAAEVMAGDALINEMRLSTEKRCYSLLAMQQPVAGDMRTIVSALTIVSELERIGDHAKRIAKLVKHMAGAPLPQGAEPLPAIPMGDLARMGEMALDMLDRVLHAVAHLDLDEARAVCGADDQVDALYRQSFNVTLSYMLENTRVISHGTYLIQVMHEVERVADRATNIAERLIYARTGELVDLNI